MKADVRSMKEELSRYQEALLKDIPSYIFEGLLTVFCIGLVLLVIFKRRNIWRGLIHLALTEYIFFIYCVTVVFREIKGERQYEFELFWSYDKPVLLVENIMNVVVFVPLGMLLAGAIKELRWWQSLLIGGGISATIELIQLTTKRGFAEFDDVMHNTLGCMIGYVLYSLARFGYERISMRSVRTLVET